MALGLLGQTGRAKARDDHAEEAIGDRQIEQVIAGGRVIGGKVIAQTAIQPRVVEVALEVAHAGGEPAPGGLVDVIGRKLAAALGDELVHRLGEARAPIGGGLGRQIDADEAEAVRKLFAEGQGVEGRDDEALGQVASSAEDHHRAGRRCRRGVGLGRRLCARGIGDVHS